MSYRQVFIPGENGNYVSKFMAEEEAAKNPDVRYQMEAVLGSYQLTDKEHIENTKAVLLDQLIDSIKELAKNDAFWIVKEQSDHENNDGEYSVGWKVSFPQFERLYTKDEEKQIKNMLSACFKGCNKV